MKPSGSSIVVGVSLALLLPTAAIAQEPAADSLVMEDGTGDFHVLYRDLVRVLTDEPTDGPAHADLIGVTVSVDGERLTVRFDAAEAVPEVPDPSGLPFAYILYIETDGDAHPDWSLYAQYANGSWYGQLFDIGDGETSIPGEAMVVDGAVTASADLDALPVPPSEMRFTALAQVYDHHGPSSVEDVTVSGDRVPDDEDDWRVLGESDPVATSG